MESARKHDKIKLVEINSYLTCYLCKGYLIDATTISECLHSFCRSCIIKFLRENCYCPVCEVIINKAKPCLKLDKTLQDIVYKLVPELFIKEMTRRKQFYMERPELMAKTTPEERGEDTERTIFNPQDAISLSIEYISDDSAPGAIRLPPPNTPIITTTGTTGTKNGTILTAANNNNNTSNTNLNNNNNNNLNLNNNNNANMDDQHDNPMKRYLQCPGMCRIEVLKKFVRNKYNVDTSKFHIDILYKRVPLPDHYTLIDIGYIYSWKRNEPMKFFFRITDINKVTERFDYFDSTKPIPEICIPKPPAKAKQTERTRLSASKRNEIKQQKLKQQQQKIKDEIIKTESDGEKINESSMIIPVKKESVMIKEEKLVVDNEQKPKQELMSSSSPRKLPPPLPSPKQQQASTNEQKNVLIKSDNKNNVMMVKEEKSDIIKQQPPSKIKIENNSIIKNNVLIKPEIAEEIKNKIQSGQHNIKNSVYTNITLNRDDNVEIITKIQKVSNKEGQPIGLNIINHTVKKTNKVQNNKVPSNNNNNNSNSNNKIRNLPTPPPVTTATTVPVAPITATTTISTTTTTKSVASSLSQQSSSSSDVKVKSGGVGVTTTEKTEIEHDIEKSNFFKSIQLTACTKVTTVTSSSTTTVSASSSSSSSLPTGKHQLPPVINKPPSVAMATPSNNGSGGSSSQKRKSSSPIKNDKKLMKQYDKKPVKIIIQSKNISNPTVRQMVSNVNQNTTSLNKIVEQITPKTNNNTVATATATTTTMTATTVAASTIPSTTTTTKTDIRSFIDNCNINIPSSLSITLNEGENNGRTLPNIPPVKNYIEIVKLPDNGEKPSTPTSFQKMYEQTVEKNSTTPTTNNTNSGGGNKRKILEIASQLQKKSKLEMCVGTPDKFTTPISASTPKTSATMHSTSLGLNYTVSVNQPPKLEVKKSVLLPKLLSPPPPPKRPLIPTQPNRIKAKSLSPEHKNLNNSSINNNSTAVTVMKNNTVAANMSKNNCVAMTTTTTTVAAATSTKTTTVSNNTVVSAPSTTKSITLSPQNGKSSSTTSSSASSALNSHQLLEKYNIQNLAQLTASFNFNAPPFVTTNGGGGGAAANVALQHAMLLKHIEHQNWLNMNQGPLLQYEKYLQSLSQNQNKIVGNIKEN